MIDGRDFLDGPVKNMEATYDNSRKIASGIGNDYTTGCLLDYSYVKELDANPRAIQEIDLNWNLEKIGNTTLVSLLEEAKRNYIRIFEQLC